jgi:hypothetical protein
LEYGSTVWSVANKKEAIIIENVQRRDTAYQGDTTS